MGETDTSKLLLRVAYCISKLQSKKSYKGMLECSSVMLRLYAATVRHRRDLLCYFAQQLLGFKKILRLTIYPSINFFNTIVELPIFKVVGAL